MIGKMEFHCGLKLAFLDNVKMKLCLIFLFFLITKVSASKFGINYDNNSFEKDGKPFRYVSGSFHYSRTHPDQWEDRIVKMRAAGLNAVQTYVPWNWHEFKSGTFTWDGASDLGRFLTLSQKHGLVVLVRLGPFICGEWEFGGYPAWLLYENPDMVFRTNDPAYMKYVTRWYDALLNKVKPFLYDNGGPVVMVQIENEYGSYFACDYSYTLALRDQVRSVLGNDVVIYTTDGGADYFLKCGAVNGTYPTIDFGLNYNASSAFQPQRDYVPKGPLVNSEFYSGWLDHWGTGHSRVDATALAKSLDILLAYGANINMYMYIGGTNFGFFNGANSPPYQPVPTSYDYDSPISEAGDLTPKFLAVRDIVSKYLPLPSDPLPSNSTKAAYGQISMNFVSTIQDALHILSPNGPVKTVYPVNMEKIQFYDGFILYRFILGEDYKDPTPLYTRGVRDRAIVMVNSVPFGLLDRELNMTVNITGSKGQAVDILVENQGRIGFSTNMNFNTKGLVENVTLAGKMVTNWSHYPIHLENIGNLTKLMKSGKLISKPASISADGKMSTPSIYRGEFGIPKIQAPCDTFVDPTSWGKGQLIINNYNLGRYWPARGPQVTLYVPGPVLHNYPPSNEVYMFEIESPPSADKNNVTFTDKPQLAGPNSPDFKLVKNNLPRSHH